jgi:hypothetical protein
MVLSNENAKERFVEASKFPGMRNVIVNVLRNPKSSEYWIKAKEESKSEIYKNLLRQAFLPQTKPERDEKSKVLSVLQSFDDIFLALDVCPCADVKDEIVQKCLKSLSAAELNDITNEFDRIEGLHLEVVNIYFICLRRCIVGEIRRDSNHANIVELLEKLSTEEEGKKNKLER